MSLFCSCHSFNEFNFPAPTTLHQEEGKVEDEAQEKKYDTSSDIFPIYLFADIKEDLNYFENKGVLTHKIIASGLSELKTNLRRKGWILSKLVLKKKNLHTVNILNQYNELTWVDMCGNNITNMKFVQNMIGLKYLALAHNDIEELVFPQGLFHLEVLDLSFNRISLMPDTFSQQFHLLTYLNLSHNYISKINGLIFTYMQCLRILDLSFNKLKKIENFTNLKIRELHLQNNQIKEYVSGENGLSSNKNLITIDISHNCISTLELFTLAFSLLKINVASNAIENPAEILHLKYLFKLRDLNLSNNPVISWPLYENYVKSIVKNLSILDDNNTCDTNTYYNYHLNTNRHFWDQFMEYHGRNIVDQSACLLRKNTIRMLSSKLDNIFIILVGTLHPSLEKICRQTTREYPNIEVLKKVTTCPSKRRNLINVTNEQYHALLKRGEFIATVEQYSYSYGYSRTEVNNCFKHHKICLTDMELKAALSVRAFGLEPYLILVTFSDEKTLKNTLLENLDFLILQSMHTGIIQEKIKEVSTGTSSSNIISSSEHTVAYSENSNDEMFINDISLEENESDISVCDWYEFYENIGAPFKTKIIKTPVAEWQVEKLDEIKCLEEEDKDCEEKNDPDKAEQTELSKITKKKELSINRQILENAQEIVFKDIFQKSEFYEKIYNEHRELFYSSVKLRDLSDDTQKFKVLINSIVQNHGKRPMGNPYLVHSLRRDPLYETYKRTLLNE